MDEDIVARLRGEQNIQYRNAIYTFPPTKDVLEAADEIERLRIEHEALRIERDAWKARALELDALWVKDYGHG